MAARKLTGTTPATVREWRDEEGWGVLDSPDTPGGCWAHFSHIEMSGYRSLTPGRAVLLEWEAPGQDGYGYRAVRVVP
jgi:cold shock protein